MSFEAQRAYLSRKVAFIAVDFPIKIPGQPFRKPDNTPYGEFHIMNSKSFVVGGEGAGKIRNRYAGMVQLDIYVPEAKGTAAATKAMDAVKELFAFKQGRDTAGCTYKFKGAEPIDPSTNAGWTVFTIRVPFTRDEIEKVQISINA